MFQDRAEGGRKLAARLAPYQKERSIVLALPRGGVLVGYEVAEHLQKPLDIMVVRKVGAPGQQELAVGAVGPGDVVVWNWDLLRRLNLSPHLMEDTVAREKAELSRRLKAFRGNRPYPDLSGMTVILVDDGLATGASARAAIHAVRNMGPGKVVLAVPVGAPSTVAELRREVDELICLESPESFEAVSAWYAHFPQNTDEEVVERLRLAWHDERTRHFVP